MSDRFLALLGFIVVAATAWYWQFGKPDRRSGGPIAVLTIFAALAVVGDELADAGVGQ